MCEITDFMNNESKYSNQDFRIDIYFLNDFSFNEKCFFKFKNLLTIAFYGINLDTKINFYNNPLQNVENIKVIYFESFKIKDFLIFTKPQTENSILIFNNCLFSTKITLNSYTEVQFVNSVLTDITIKDVKRLFFDTCEFNIKDFSEFQSCDYISIKKTDFFRIINLTPSILRISFSKTLIVDTCISQVSLEIIAMSDVVEINGLQTNNYVLTSYITSLMIKNSIFKKEGRLKLIDCGFTTIYNNYFTKCWGGSAVFIDNFKNTINFDTNTFIENTVGDIGNGGAIYIQSSLSSTFSLNVKRINIKNCKFISNTAQNGGAIYFGKNRLQIIIENCLFKGNEVFIYSKDEGNGGAIFGVINGPLQSQYSDLLIKNSTFIENLANRGGALYLTSFPPEIDNYNNLIQNNSALYAGGGIFTSNYNNVNDIYPIDFKNIKNNKAKHYGNEIASTVTRIEHVIVDNNEFVYSGQEFGVQLMLFDVYNQSITKINENFEVLCINEYFQLVQVYSKTSGYHRFYFLQRANIKINETTTIVNIKMNLNIFLTKLIPITVLTTCPKDMESVVNDNFIICQKKSFEIGTVILISVICGVSLFIIGIGLGILIIYSCWKVVKKLKKLEKKEKAEREIVKKIVDKQFIFGCDTSPLLGKDFKSKMFRDNSSSFLIPIEDLTIDKKIGEGGCGTVYSGKWGTNTVAIKSIKLLSDDEDNNEDFEREAILLI
ncbi:hypothetical protein ABK040_005612 [Willaertia magna]